MKRSDVLIGVFAVVTTGIAVSRLMPLTPKAVAVVAVDHPGTADLRRTGNPLARHHLIIYTDYECPACRQLDAEIVDFLSQHGDSVVVFYRHFPL